MMRRPSMVDYPGELAIIMFTAGCNFRCGFCHNAQLLGCHSAKRYTYGQLAERLQKAKEEWVRAVTVSGGEPTLQPALKDTLRFIREMGFLVKLDTNGANPAVLKECLPFIDYVAMDVKCSMARYPEFVHFNEVNAIRESIRMIISSAADYEFRTTVVESFHTPAEMAAAAEELRGAKRWILQPFVPHEDLPDPALCSEKRTRPGFLQQCVNAVIDIVPGTVVR
jgi:pyruvate formate lyase activating enzyme